mgnify:CR=1 FL=1
MRNETQEFFKYTQSLPFKDITHFWDIPHKEMLDEIDWSKFYKDALPTLFHGDLQPENILFDFTKQNFVLIDWRQQFGDSLKVGDVYYDLAKLYHAIMINGQTILQDMFDCKINGNEASVSFYAKSNLV